MLNDGVWLWGVATLSPQCRSINQALLSFTVWNHWHNASSFPSFFSDCQNNIKLLSTSQYINRWAKSRRAHYRITVQNEELQSQSHASGTSAEFMRLYVGATQWKGSYNTVRRWSGRSGWWGLWRPWKSGCRPSPRSESLPQMKGRWGFFYEVTINGTLLGFHLTNTAGHVLQVTYLYEGLLARISLVFCALTPLSDESCESSLSVPAAWTKHRPDLSTRFATPTFRNDSQGSDYAEAINWCQFGLTWAACTCGDWITDDCADWITPWTWNWPPGSWTTATEEPPSDIWKKRRRMYKNNMCMRMMANEQIHFIKVDWGIKICLQ